MDFKQIEAFVKVVELASFSAAAEALFISQSSVSLYIIALEKELDIKLINRSTKEISPTLAGKMFYEDAVEILARKRDALEKMKCILGNFSGEINILASSVPSQYILPELLARFAENYPDITFNVKQADTLDVSRGIAAQQAEVGFTGGRIEDDKCEYREFMTEKMVFIVPCDKDFSDEKVYSLEELLYNYPYISREKGSGTRTQYEKFFMRQNIDLSKMKICAGFDNTQSIISGVMNGLGVSIVSELAARSFIKHKTIMPIKLEEELPERKFYYALRKNIFQSHLVNLFIEFLEAQRLKSS